MMNVWWRRVLILVLVLAGYGLGLSSVSRASYFPDPITSNEWDVLWGNITPGGAMVIGDEIAGYDSGGVIRLRWTLESDNFFGNTAFYEPSGGTDTSTFTWKLYDTSEGIVYSADADLSNWGTWVGSKLVYQVDITRGDPQAVIPEPGTWLILVGVVLSGVVVWKRKNFRSVPNC